MKFINIIRHILSVVTKHGIKTDQWLISKLNIKFCEPIDEKFQVSILMLLNPLSISSLEW